MPEDVDGPHPAAEGNRSARVDSPLTAPINRGAGRTLAAGYALFALAATGRSIVQLATRAERAPLAYSLSAVAAVIYIVATVCLGTGGRTARRVAIVACGVELAGVLIVGAASHARPELFPDRTVWSHFGQGYGYLPAVLPVLGLWWLLKKHPPTPPHPAP